MRRFAGGLASGLPAGVANGLAGWVIFRSFRRLGCGLLGRCFRRVRGGQQARGLDVKKFNINNNNK